MSSRPYDRAAMLLGSGALVSVLFTFATSSNNNFVSVGWFGVIVLVVLGGAALAAGATSNPTVVLAVGALFVLGALMLFAVIPFGFDAVRSSDAFFYAQASTMSLYGGLGIGLLVVGYLGRTYPDGIDATM